MNRNEYLDLINNNDISSTLNELASSLCCLADRKTIDAKHARKIVPALTERQHVCSIYALELARKGEWPHAMHELTDAFQNYEALENDRELTVNEAVCFAAITKAMFIIFNLKGGKTK